MGEIRYIIIAKQCEVAGTSSILDGCLKKSFSSVYDLGKRFFGHPSRIDDVPCNLTQFCYSVLPWRNSPQKDDKNMQGHIGNMSKGHLYHLLGVSGYHDV